MIIPNYCFGVEVEQINRKKRTRETVVKDCVKIKDGKCTAWADPCKKMGVDRGGYLGCAFSPLEIFYEEEDVGKVRVGQQKQKRKSR